MVINIKVVGITLAQRMTYERNNLSEYVEFKRPCRVNLGDNRVILAYGKGTYRV